MASNETREKYRPELIKLYHDEFVGTLAKLGYLKTPPSLLDLNIELLKNGAMGMGGYRRGDVTIFNYMI